MRDYDRLTPKERQAQAGVGSAFEPITCPECGEAAFRLRRADGYVLVCKHIGKLTAKQSRITVRSPFGGHTYELLPEELKRHCFHCARAGVDGYCSNHEHLRGCEPSPIQQSKPATAEQSKPDADGVSSKIVEACNHAFDPEHCIVCRMRARPTPPAREDKPGAS